MKNNIRLYFKINIELYEKIKNEALIQDISIARLCREKIMGCPQLTRIELTMKEIQKKLNTKLNLNRRYKNGNKTS